MNYTEYVSALQQFAVMQDTNGIALLNGILPTIITQAELMMFRDPDLDFLATRMTDISQTTTPGIREVPIPAAFVVIETVALITPTGAKPTDRGAQRIPLLSTSRPWLDMIWPIETVTQAPKPFETYWAVFSEEELDEGDDPTPGPSSFLVAPTVDQPYVAEMTGTFRPQPISAANPVTFLSTHLPDLLISASMIFISGFQRKWGAQSDDPRLAISWSAIYEQQKHGAAVEEARKNAMGTSWTPYAPQKFANLPRTSLSPPIAAPTLQGPPQ